MNNVNLRTWELKDAPALAEAINNKKVMDNLRDGLPFPYTEKDAEWFINAVLEDEKAKRESAYIFAITYNGEVAGNIAVYRKDNVHRLTTEIGYYIGERFWGKGIMTEAVKQMCDYIFKNTDIVRIFADPYDFNVGSCRVLEKAGFQFEGTLRKNAIKNGQIVDMKMYALIKETEES